jgi:hypothetical protein
MIGMTFVTRLVFEKNNCHHSQEEIRAHHEELHKLAMTALLLPARGQVDRKGPAIPHPSGFPTATATISLLV